ncbi:MAG TPA: tandem-95 repeat protein [Anaerolineae bacterium]|nr:tandem-95 repeat protein [Anaerolineae bacterium]
MILLAQLINVNDLKAASLPEQTTSTTTSLTNSALITPSGNITLIKEANPADGTDFFFTAAGLPSADSLLGHWRFDEGSGTTATDNSANNRHATLINGPLYTNNVPPALSLSSPYALDFDGTNDYVDIPDMNESFADGFTVAVWAYYDSLNTYSRIIDFGNGSASNNIILYNLSNNTTLSFNVFNGSTSSLISAAGAIELNTWIHLAATVDGSGNATIYKNGTPIQTGTVFVPNSILRTNNYVGRSNWLGDAYFNGKMDDLRIYNRSLTATEIADLANGFDPTLYFILDDATPDDNDTITNTITYSLPLGTYTFTETMPAIWQLDSLTCATTDTGDAPVVNGDAVTINLDASENITCTFTNSIAHWPPVAVDDSFTTAEDTPLLITAPGIITNDTDIDTTILSTTLGTAVTNGTLALNLDGSFIYTPNLNFNGLDWFTYILSDGVSTDIATATITVTAVNDPPIASPDWYTTTSNMNLVVSAGTGVLANDSDIDNGTLTATVIDPPTLGNVSLATDGSFVYTPTFGSAGIDTFSYQATDGVLTDTAVVSITVIGVGNITIIKDASPADGTNFNFLTAGFADTSQPAQGHWPFEEGSGTTATDQSGNGHTGTLLNGPTYSTDTPLFFSNFSLQFDGVNDYIFVPINVSENSYAVSLWFKTACTNCGIYSVTDAGNGHDRHIYLNNGNICTRVWNNEVICTSGTNYADNNWHHIAHTFGGTVGGQKIYIDGVLKASGAKANSNFDWQTHIKIGFSADPNRYFNGLLDDVRLYNTALTAAQITDLANGYSSISFVLDDADPDDGDSITNTIQYLNIPTGIYTITESYPPAWQLDSLVCNSNNSGDDPIINNDTVTINLDSGEEITCTFTNSIADWPPVAVDDWFTTTEDISLLATSAGVMANDSDIDTTTLSTTLAVDVTNGTLNLNLDGSFVYTPNLNFNGLDWFTYVLSDGLSTDMATVTITISAANDPPIAVSDWYTLTGNANLLVPAAAGLLNNDSDIDSTTLTATIMVPPTVGTLTLANDGSFVYTPTLGTSGIYTFTYQVTDGALNDTGVVSLTLISTAPIAVPDAYTLTENMPLVVSTTNGLLSNDIETDGDPLTATILTPPPLGNLSLAADGSFSYTPPWETTGVITFAYQVSDGFFTNSAVVTLTLNLPLFCYATPDNGATVYTSTNAIALQNAVDVAAVDGLVKVAGRCAGVQTIAGETQTLYLDKALTIQGGYTPTLWSALPDPLSYPTIIDAEGAGRVISLTTNADVTLAYLTITNGQAVSGQDGIMGNPGTNGTNGQDGGGIYNNGTLSLLEVVVSHNNAGHGGAGGAGNNGLTGNPGGTGANGGHGNNGGHGGGIYNNGHLTIEGATVHHNSSGAGGAGGAGGTGGAGITGNAVAGGTGGTGGTGGLSGDGAGIYNNGYLTITATTILTNSNGAGGTGGDGGNGGRGGNGGVNCPFLCNYYNGGRGGNGGQSGMGGATGSGGAIYNNGSLLIASTTLSANTNNIGGSSGLNGAGGHGGDGSGDAFGGPGGAGGNGSTSGAGGYGGAIYNTSNLIITNTTLINNVSGVGGLGMNGGNGGNVGSGENYGNMPAGLGGSGTIGGAAGYGAGIYNIGNIIITNSAFNDNINGSGGTGGRGGHGGSAGSGGVGATGGTGGLGGAGGSGTAIYNTGSITITNSTFNNNINNGSGAGGDAGNGGSASFNNGGAGGNGGHSGAAGHGGAIYNSGVLSLKNSDFTGNINNGSGHGGNGGNGGFANINTGGAGGHGGHAGVSGHGGAIYNSGVLSLKNTDFTGNINNNGGHGGHGGHSTTLYSLNGGNGGLGTAGGHGGAIYNTNILTISYALFNNNMSGAGGNGGHGGNSYRQYGGNGGLGADGGAGGGIYNTGSLTITYSTINDNASGHGGTGGNGGYYQSGIRTAGTSGAGGNSGHGAGIYNTGFLSLIYTTVSHNTNGVGGTGGVGGSGPSNPTNGGAGGNGGHGAGIYNTNFLRLVQATVTHNINGFGGTGGRGGDTGFFRTAGRGGNGGNGGLGAIYNSNFVTLTHVTLGLNASGNAGVGGLGGLNGEYQNAPSGTDGLVGLTGNLQNQISGTISSINTILGGSLQGADCEILGTVIDNGYNLDSDDSCALTTTSSITNTGPSLDILAYHPDGMFTNALLFHSQATDAIPLANCPFPTDQRGITRPQGSACDIGAFERIPIAVIDTFVITNSLHLDWNETIHDSYALWSSSQPHSDFSQLTPYTVTEADITTPSENIFYRIYGLFAGYPGESTNTIGVFHYHPLVGQ